MSVFLLGCLWAGVGFFLVMISVRAIRIEKLIIDMVALTETRVTKLYKKDKV